MPGDIIDTFRGPYWFLSNFAEHSFKVHIIGVHTDLREYRTVEHAFQCAKTTDRFEQQRIANAETAKDAKALGRMVKAREDWNEIRLAVMRECLAYKFFPGTDLAHLLVATEDAFLAEGNTWGDTFWGTTPAGGSNWLGWLLMAQRAYLRAVEPRKTDGSH